MDIQLCIKFFVQYNTCIRCSQDLLFPMCYHFPLLYYGPFFHYNVLCAAAVIVVARRGGFEENEAAGRVGKELARGACSYWLFLTSLHTI